MPSVGFETTISACERPQTYASDSTATGTGNTAIWFNRKIYNLLTPIYAKDTGNNLPAINTRRTGIGYTVNQELEVRV